MLPISFKRENILSLICNKCLCPAGPWESHTGHQDSALQWVQTALQEPEGHFYSGGGERRGGLSSPSGFLNTTLPVSWRLFFCFRFFPFFSFHSSGSLTRCLVMLAKSPQTFSSSTLLKPSKLRHTSVPFYLLCIIKLLQVISTVSNFAVVVNLFFIHLFIKSWLQDEDSRL